MFSTFVTSPALAATKGVADLGLGVPVWVWAAVLGGIVCMLVVDLVFLHKDAHVVSIREAAWSSAVWIGIGCAFGVGLTVLAGGAAGGQYFSGYLIEKSLSIDNIFVFALLLGAFAVPAKNQHRVLFWGIFGALVMRAAFIAVGAQLLDAFHFMIYVFGGFLMITGVRMLRHDHKEMQPEKNPLVRLVRKVMPVTDDYDGQRFFVRRPNSSGKIVRVATPMFVVLVAIETTDVIFAVDSIPAVFAVSSEPFIVFTSNAFAILGLRALYFLLAGMMDRFVYLKHGLAAILAFVGVKMLLVDLWHVPTALSLGVIATILGASIAASLRRTSGAAAAADPLAEDGDADAMLEARDSAR